MVNSSVMSVGGIAGSSFLDTSFKDCSRFFAIFGVNFFCFTAIVLKYKCLVLAPRNASDFGFVLKSGARYFCR